MTQSPAGTSDDPAPALPRHAHLVVGLGASAGGLQALRAFFEPLPPDSGMAFVVVLHPLPHHEAHAADILRDATRMPVLALQAPTPLVPDRVYLAAPGTAPTLANGLLQPGEAAQRGGVSIAVDTFFRALAEARGARAVGVVLSGTGSDGALGLKRLKELGGVTLAQLPADAHESGKPRAAIATGAVDVVLAAADMPAWLLRLARTAASIRLPADGAGEPGAAAEPPHAPAADAALSDILALLHQRTRHDFQHYRRPTVLRRLERRMQVVGTPTLEAYRDHLMASEAETPALLQDLLISVTQFFRDPGHFQALEQQVLPALVAAAAGERPLRAWVVGCATGEEAYSVAMLLHEACARAPSAVPPFQVFASDIDERALALAREGLYPDAIVADVPPARLAQFFEREGEQLRVAAGLRERVLFAPHNVLHNTPFSRLDLILCRNLLIYLDARAQAAVLESFRFALNPGGVLFLGSSETTGAAPGRFSEADRTHRLYRAQSHRLAPPGGARLGASGALPAAPEAGGSRRGRPSPAELHLLARSRQAPPSALIDAQGRVLHLSDDMTPWLRAPHEGLPSPMLRERLQPRLRLALDTALHLAQRPGASAEAMAPVDIDADADSGPLRLGVEPLSALPDGQGLLLVTLRPLPGPAPVPRSEAAGTPAEQLLLQLEAETTGLQRQLQAVILHGEATTQDLIACNEELQSSNEELATVNAELTLKLEEARRARDELRHLLDSADVAFVFVDAGLRLQRFTPRATALFGLAADDVGRPLQHLARRLSCERLLDDARQAIETLQPVERELQVDEGRAFIARALPSRGGAERAAGAVLSFVDVTPLRQAQADERRSAEQLRLAAESTRDFAILTTDDEGLITSWNQGAERLFGAPAAQMLGRPLAEIFTDEDRAAGVPQREMQVARANGRCDDERWHRRADGSVFYCSGVTTLLEGGRGFSKIARDLTGSQHAALARERQLTDEQAGRREAEAGMAAKEVFLAVMSHELKHPLNLIHLNAELLTRLAEVRAVPAAHRAAQLILQTAMGQARIVDDLLDLSRVRTGKLTLERMPVDLVNTLRRITGALQPDALAKGVRLVLEAGAAPALTVLFDPVRADQVVWNLLSNALKFTPQGGSVRARLSTEGGDARLTVTDTGCGIAPEDLGRVFDMFSQAGNAPPGADRTGLGIGLALVRELVLAHGGRVQARSEGVGRGAELSVWVPVYGGPLPQAAPPPATSVLQGLRVLVVDDSVDSADTQALLLRLAGAQVVAATSGAEALACLDRERFELLVSDISMPGMSGLDLIAAVRARPEGPQLMALACSGYGRPQDVRRAEEAGYDTLLPKPASLAQIEQAVAALRARRAG